MVQDVSKYRPISLTPTLSNVFLSFLATANLDYRLIFVEVLVAVIPS